MLSKVTAKNVGDVFFRHTVYYSQCHDFVAHLCPGKMIPATKYHITIIIYFLGQRHQNSRQWHIQRGNNRLAYEL